MAKPASAGTRDRLVTMQKLGDAQAAMSGLPKQVVVSTFTMWAARTDLDNSGWSRERSLGNQLSARMETEWSMAYRADLDPELVDVAKAFRLVYEGREHDIVIATQIGRRQGIKLTTTVRVG